MYRLINIKKTLIFGILLACFFQCKKPQESEKNITELIVTADKDYTATIAESSITFSNKVPHSWTEVSIKTLTLSDKASASKKIGDKLSVGISNTITVTAEDNSTKDYTVRINADTPPVAPSKPTVQTGVINNISISGATVSGSILSFGNESVTAHGHIWGLSNNLTITGSNLVKTNLGSISTSGSPFVTTITGLSENTTYYVRGYASNSAGTGYGEVKNFKTLQLASLGLISGNSVLITIKGNGANTIVNATSNIVNLGSNEVIQHGHIYSTSVQNSDLILGGSNVKSTALGSKTTAGNFVSILLNLPGSTTYYIRPYVITNAGTVYGDQIEFTTPEGTPVVNLGNVIPLLNSISLSGGITNLGGGDAIVTSYGHIWSTTTGNLTTVSSNKTSYGNTSEVLNFSSIVTGLTKNTPHYLVSYATNSIGTGYSQVRKITTLNDETDILSMSIFVNGFRQTRSVSEGTITGTDITFSGLPYGSTQALIVAVNLSDQATATFSNINSLSNTSYLSVGTNTVTVRASDGSEEIYTIYLNTISLGTPSVNTLSAESISINSATLKGEVTNVGTTAISGYGFVYSTNSNDSLTLSGSSNRIQVGSNIGVASFNSSLSELSSNTTYYYVAYASNAGGTTYGAKYSFTTLEFAGFGTITGNTQTIISISGTGSNVTVNATSNIASLGSSNLTQHGHIYSLTAQNENLELGKPEVTATELGTKTELGDFESEITVLNGNSTYYIRPYATNSSGTSYGNQTSFMTPEGVPTVTIGNIVSSINSATLSGAITNLGSAGATISDYGHIWSTTNTNLTTALGTKTDIGSTTSTGAFGSTATSLTKNTTYYSRTYATNSGGTGYSSISTFTTLNDEASILSLGIETGSYSQTVSGSAIIGNTLSFTGVPYGVTQVSIASFSLSDQAEGTIGGNTLTGGTVLSIGTNTIIVTASDGSTQNYTINITNESAVAPTVNTLAASSVNYTTATMNGQITSIGNTAISGYGFIYSTTTGDALTLTGSGTDMQVGTTLNAGESFTENLTGLVEGTTYYYVAYARNEAGPAYGIIQSFTTNSDAPPTVNTLAASSVNLTSATLNGEVTNIGATAISGYGFIYSTTTGDALTITGSGTRVQVGTTINAGVSFTENLTGLTTATTYYYVAYARNNGGTSYGIIQSFSTTVNTPPTVITLTASNISFTTVTLNGEVTSTGTPAISDYGFVYNTTTGDTLTLTGSGTSVSVGSSIGVASFTENITGLVEGTTYYYVAYARNSTGTSYGTPQSFTLNISIPPTVNTLTASGISYTIATLNGEITNTGNSPISGYGFVYSTTSGDALTITGSGTDLEVGVNTGVTSFTENVIGLMQGTTYYYVAYARNNGGTTYGIVRSFTTDNYVPPVVNTLAATSVGYTNATINAQVTNIGNAPMSGYGFVYSKSSGDSLTLTGGGTIVQLGNNTGVGNFTHNLTALSDNTLYYYVAYIRNTVTTTYGTQMSFTTDDITPPIVNTTAANNVSGTGIILRGRIISLGNDEVSQHGFVYSTNSGSNLVVSGSGVLAIPLGTNNTIGAFSSTLATLNSNSRYYTRAYATNPEGTTYGIQRSFIPNNDPANQVIEVGTPTELQAVNNDLDANYVQIADIDLSSIDNFVRIGADGSMTRFEGTYNGNGFVISNLTMNTDITDVALFAAIGTSGIIENIGLENINVRGGNYVGGLVAINRGTVLNSYTLGIVESTSYYASGLVAYNIGIIRDSYSSVNSLASNSNSAGLVAQSTTSTANITNSYAMGTSRAGATNVGGIVGETSTNSSITTSYSAGNTVGGGGGAIGFKAGSATVSNVYWNTETSGRTNSAAGTGRTSAQILAGSSNFSGFSTTDWDFGNSTSYPILKNNIASADKQYVHQATGLLQLSISGTSNFFGGSVLQNEITASAATVATAGDTLFAIDVNAAADNDSSRADYWDCTAGTGNTLLTTNSINGTNVTLQFASSGTTDKTAWTKGSGTSCNIVRSNAGSNPVSGNTLSIEAVITKGSESYTKSYNITFEN